MLSDLKFWLITHICWILCYCVIVTQGMIPQSGHKRVCCGTRDITLNPCPPVSCPIMSVKGGLPAMPFMAAIDPKSGDCQGIHPQVITGLE